MASSYTDGLIVKISEKYKPPFRISRPVSNFQKLLSVGKLIEDIPENNGQLEKDVIERVQEMTTLRTDAVVKRKERLAEKRQEFIAKIEKEKIAILERIQAEAKKLDEANAKQVAESEMQIAEKESQSPASSQLNFTKSFDSGQNYQIQHEILMPIPVTSYSTDRTNILKPMLTSTSVLQQQPVPCKSFNLSDFESDTSSPFDNMELKSMNDFEELAQILKSDKSSLYSNSRPQSNVYPSNTQYQQPVVNHPGQAYTNLPIGRYTEFTKPISQSPEVYSQSPIVTQNRLPVYNSPSSFNQFTPVAMNYSQYNSNMYASQSNYQVPSNMSTYQNQMNGYLYNIPSHVTSQIQPRVSANAYTQYAAGAIPQSIQKSNCKSVPDLVKSIEKELDSTHLDETTAHFSTSNVPVPVRPKSTDAVYSKSKHRSETVDILNKLSREERQICENVSDMGFPLDRVARVCKALGCNQKKIIDHLLVLSELLDLGFSEKDASEALLLNNNDKDKAIDRLIS